MTLHLVMVASILSYTCYMLYIYIYISVFHCSTVLQSVLERGTVRDAEMQDKPVAALNCK